MLLEALGFTLVGGAATGLLFTKKDEKRQIRKKLEGMILGERMIHHCVADGHDIMTYPTVEYVLPKDYGYRVIMHLPDSVSIDDFKRREDAFEYKIGHPIVLQSEGDVLFMDIVTKEGSFTFPPIQFQEMHTHERVNQREIEHNRLR